MPEEPPPATDAPPRWSVFAVLGIVLAAAFLRAWHLNAWPLWIDEYGTWWVAAEPDYGEVWRRAVAIQGQSPLYYLIVRASLDAFGTSPLALRLPSIVFGALIVVLAYFVGARMFGDRRVGAMAALTFALNPQLIGYAQEARPYPLALALALASFLAYVALRERPSVARTGAWIALTALTWYAHYLFGVVAAIQAVHVLASGSWRWSRLGPWALRFALLALAMAPGLFQFATLVGRSEDLDWVAGERSLKVLWMRLREYYFYFLDFQVLVPVAVISVLLAASGDRTRGGSPRTVPGLLFLWLVLPGASALAAFLLLDVNLIVPRYLVLALPAALLANAVILALPRRPGPLALLPAVIWTVMLLSGLKDTYDHRGMLWHAHDERWAPAVAPIANGWTEGDLVLYNTAFVELDAVAAGRAGADTVAFAAWPVRAHLPKDRPIELVPLPFSNPEPAQARAILQRILDARRTWVVGKGDQVAMIAGLAGKHDDLEPVDFQTHGAVRTALIVRRRP